MICYRDRSFCSAYAQKRCINHKCSRALTPNEAERAQRWWGDGEPPIAYMDLSIGCKDIKHA